MREKFTYSCDQCIYKSTKKGSLINHIESIHGSVTYLCDQCNYKATQIGILKGKLNLHMEKHMGNLKKHIESIHEKVTYQ